MTLHNATNLAHEGRRPGDAGGLGASAVPAGWPHQPAPGRSGHHACRHYDRRAGCAAGSECAVGGVTPAPWTVRSRSLARIAPRDHTPLGQSRSGTPAGERARSGRAAQAAFSAARPVRRMRTGSPCGPIDRSASAGGPLPSSFILLARVKRSETRERRKRPRDRTRITLRSIRATASANRESGRCKTWTAEVHWTSAWTAGSRPAVTRRICAWPKFHLSPRARESVERERKGVMPPRRRGPARAPCRPRAAPAPPRPPARRARARRTPSPCARSRECRRSPACCAPAA